MSFINLHSTDQWTEADIVNRTESMIASEFPKTRIDILTRKVQGQVMGYALTEQEAADLQAYQVVCYQAGAAADAARADMALLNAVLAYETQLARLAQPEVLEPATVIVVDMEGIESEVPNPAIAQDAAERADATIKTANATPEVIALYDLRNPVVEPVEVLDEPAA